MSELLRLRSQWPGALWRDEIDSPTDTARAERVVEWWGSHRAAELEAGGHSEYAPDQSRCGAEVWIRDGSALCNTCGQRWFSDDDELIEQAEIHGWVWTSRRYTG